VYEFSTFRVACHFFYAQIKKQPPLKYTIRHDIPQIVLNSSHDQFNDHSRGYGINESKISLMFDIDEGIPFAIDMLIH